MTNVLSPRTCGTSSHPSPLERCCLPISFFWVPLSPRPFSLGWWFSSFFRTVKLFTVSACWWRCFPSPPFGRVVLGGAAFPSLRGEEGGLMLPPSPCLDGDAVPPRSFGCATFWCATFSPLPVWVVVLPFFCYSSSSFGWCCFSFCFFGRGWRRR